MSKIDYIFTGHNQDHQYQAVQLLKRCFDEWVDFENSYGTTFPFREESFMAYDEKGRPVGHVGLMPFAVADGCGGLLKAAGVASVGVAPEARRQGIADKLCCMAAEWAEKQGFDCMPLYTGMPQVYAKSHWQTVQPNGAMLIAPAEQNNAPAVWKKGSELTVNEKTQIIQSYLAIRQIPGRVLRTFDQFFHSWEWLFAMPTHQWLVDEKVNGYALKVENVLAEIAGDLEYYAKISGAGKAFLAFEDPAYQALTALGWQEQDKASITPKGWHGEVAMNYTLPGKNTPANFFFPLGDKF